MLRSAALFVALILAGLLAAAASRTPKPQAADAPAGAFSAARAFADVEQIGVRPHPTGSAENARVRDYLLGRMRALGLEVRVQAGEASERLRGPGEPWLSGAKVENLVGVLPGRSRSLPALAVVAHYDSVPGSPGAADDSAGVASALETARALKASGGTARDVVFLLTDGEEAGLIGARAFWAHDPLAKRSGAVINMEARGDGGRAIMFETTRGDGATIARFSRAQTSPSANSLSAYMYSLMPNDTDFTVAKAHALPGLNFAFVGREFGYHAASATPDRLDRGALQHMGQQVLAAARELAGPAPLPTAAPDVVYSDLLGRSLVVYPAPGGWLVLLACAGLGAFAAFRARRSGGLSGPGMLRGFGAALWTILAVVPFADLARRLTGAPFDFVAQRPLLAHFPVYEAALAAVAVAVVLSAGFGLAKGRGRIVLALVPLAAGAACAGLGGLDVPALVCGGLAAVLAVFAFARPVDGWSGWAGAWALAFLAGVALQLLAPTTAFLVAWPLLAASVAAMAAAASRGARFGSLAGITAALAIAVVATGQLAYLGHLLVLGVGTDMPAAIAPFVFLAALVLFPLTRLWAERPEAGGAAILAGASALGLALAVRLIPYASPRTPEVSEVLWVADADTGRRVRVSPLDPLDAWSRAAMVAGGGRLRRAVVPQLWSEPVYVADTPVDGKAPLPFAAPAVKVGRDAGRVQLEIDPAPEVGALRLEVKSSAPVSAVTVEGEPAAILTRSGEWSHIIWTAPKGRLVLAFTPRGHGRLEARWAAFAPGWPRGAQPLPQRPASVMPWGVSDSTVMTGSLPDADGRF